MCVHRIMIQERLPLGREYNAKAAELHLGSSLRAIAQRKEKGFSRAYARCELARISLEQREKRC